MFLKNIINLTLSFTKDSAHKLNHLLNTTYFKKHKLKTIH